LSSSPGGPPVFCSVTTAALPDRIHTTGALLH
jgi:hypothetical protein